MKQKREEKTDNYYKYFFIFFLILILARIIASLIPDMFLLGLDFYKFLPLNVSIILIILSFIFLLKPVNEKVVSLIQYVSHVVYKKNGKIKWYNVSIFFCLILTGFYYLRVLPLLGDGITRVEDLDKVYIRTIKDYFVYRSYQSFTLLLYDYTAKLLDNFGIDNFKTFYVYNCVSGLIFIYYLLRLQTELFKNSFNRIVSFVFLFFQAYLILFMGYIEYYAIPFALSASYIYYSVRYIKGKSSLWTPALVLVILLLFHLLGVILLPSLLYLIILRGKKDSILKRFTAYEYPKMLLSLTIIGISGVLIYQPGPLHLLIDPSEFLSYHNFTSYIVYHGIDIFNFLLFGSAFSLFIVIFFRKILMERIKVDQVLNFIIINAFFGLLLLVFLKPAGNLSADWDIMTIPLLLFNLLGILLFMFTSKKNNNTVYG